MDGESLTQSKLLNMQQINTLITLDHKDDRWKKWSTKKERETNGMEDRDKQREMSKKEMSVEGIYLIMILWCLLFVI